MKEELELMLRVLYHIVPPNDFSGNTRNALELLDFNDDEKVDWQEFNRFHVLFPALFYPAFRIQQTMITQTMGQRWWDKKKRYLHEEKVRRDMIEQLAARKEHARLLKLREKRIRKKMGLLRYMFCPAQRAAFRKLFPVDDAQAEKTLSEAELQVQKAKQREVERRLRELNAKNPETSAWGDYQKRKTRMEYASVSGASYTGVGQALWSIGSKEGVKGLFSGLGSTLLRDAPFSGLNLVMYTQMRRVMNDFATSQGREATAFDTFIAGAIAGGFATFATHPPDVLRTRTQLTRAVLVEVLAQA